MNTSAWWNSIEDYEAAIAYPTTYHQIKDLMINYPVSPDIQLPNALEQLQCSGYDLSSLPTLVDLTSLLKLDNSKSSP